MKFKNNFATSMLKFLLNDGLTHISWHLMHAYSPELVTLAVALHHCYEASTLSLTQVKVIELN